MNTRPIFLSATTVALSLLLSACGGSGGGGGTEPTMSFVQTKLLRFNWTDVAGATFYRLLENPDGDSGFSQVGADIPAGTEQYDHEVPLYARLNARYILQSCNDAGCTDISELSVSGNLAEAVGYFKASNTDTGDVFGFSVALSADGRTLAVGARSEASNATDIGGDDNDNSANASGAVYIFTHNGTGWAQQAYIKAFNTGGGDRFGTAVALSADGSRLAVGAPYEDSNETGTSLSPPLGDPLGFDGDAGAVYLYIRIDNTWWPMSYVKASNTDAYDYFGTSVALSADGNTLAVGAIGEDSNGSAETDNNASDSGAVYVFTLTGTSWDQQAYIKASNAGTGDEFGQSVALSADGNTLAVGADLEDSDGSKETSNGALDSGAVYVFSRSGTSWAQQAYIKASNAGELDRFGISVALSGDGDTLAAGAPSEDSNATGINGDQNDDGTAGGAVYLFTRSGTNWSQQAYVKASNTSPDLFELGDRFGETVALSDDGNTLAVGANFESSNATGLGGDQDDNSTGMAGAVYVFTRSGSNWSQLAYVKASNTDEFDGFGKAIALAADGDTLAVGADFEDSAATGINGDQSDNSLVNPGAVYLY